MARRSTVEEWRRAIYRASQLSGNVQVLLLYLADNMRNNRQVSVPRQQMANDLGLSERRVSERVSKAHSLGWLDTVSSGYRGHVAVYVGLFPERDSGTATSTLSVPETRTLSMRERGTHGGPTTSRADLSVSGSDRNVGSYEGSAPIPVGSQLGESA